MVSYSIMILNKFKYKTSSGYLNNSPERSRTAVFGSRAQKDCHYPTGLYYDIIMIIYIKFCKLLFKNNFKIIDSSKMSKKISLFL